MYLPHCLYTSIHTNGDVVVAQCVVLSGSTGKKKQKQKQKKTTRVVIKGWY